MERIQLSGKYFKNPVYTIFVVLSIVLLFETLNWIYGYERKIAIVERLGGILGYLFILFRGGVLPEVITTVVILTLINLYHILFKIKAVTVSWWAILRYEFDLLPVLLLAFLFFNPLTQSVRYLLIDFPDYQFDYYWDKYIIGTYSWRLYSFYLIPVLIIGYGTVNLSLLIDFLKNGRNGTYPNTVSN